MNNLIQKQGLTQKRIFNREKHLKILQTMCEKLFDYDFIEIHIEDNGWNKECFVYFIDKVGRKDEKHIQKIHWLEVCLFNLPQILYNETYDQVRFNLRIMEKMMEEGFDIIEYLYEEYLILTNE